MVYAIVLAGGVGKRTGEPIPKQFIEVNKKTVLAHTLSVFERCNDVDRIIIVTLPDYINKVYDYKYEYGISKIYRVVEGGVTGIGSVYQGYKAVGELLENDDIVLIHDGVRPFVSNEVIADSITKAREYGTGLASIPCVETMVRCSDSIKSSTEMVARDDLYRVQTPQTFKAHILKGLFSSTDSIDNIKEPSIFAYYMSLGGIIHCSLGNEKNIKLTYPEDIEYFRRFFE